MRFVSIWITKNVPIEIVDICVNFIIFVVVEFINDFYGKKIVSFFGGRL